MVKVGMSIAKKRKVGTTLNESLLKSLKLQAVEENRPIADVISDAIEQYLARRQAEDERTPDNIMCPVLPASCPPASGGRASHKMPKAVEKSAVETSSRTRIVN